ncbi:hypothetical protein BAUCODRAFT_25256 [Baudoinia panamericana UAMH 10762]|uniref:Uncharacterized protein n=1 Tax=Baudoinia panamericana (strain UAMH 10762) TaxID=717646 RepID=M2N7U9_BAUPA|nr:uncharacterized protein BAUCODRAFT_25256 [Baudoinia panamericana UAMH 10762]EMC95154.1 hypothetical protein BAUCODRAFT_25256 [Baudoinia panamericana UAMH 10762]
MAVATMMPATHAPMESRKHYNQPFNAMLLCEKLEALQWQESDRLNQRLPYFPHSAAQQFVATTTPQTSAKAPNEPRTRRPLAIRQRSKPIFTADGKPCVDPGRLQAALDQASHTQSRRVSRSEHGHDPSSTQVQAQGNDTVERSESRRLSYQPGDAADRRLIVKLDEVQPHSQPNVKLHAVEHGSLAQYEREPDTADQDDVPAFGTISIYTE